MHHNPHDVLSPQQLAELLDMSERTLRRWRQKGTGPEFSKLSGRKIIYRPRDVRNWIDKHRQAYNER